MFKGSLRSAQGVIKVPSGQGTYVGMVLRFIGAENPSVAIINDSKSWGGTLYLAGVIGPIKFALPCSIILVLEASDLLCSITILSLVLALVPRAVIGY